MDFLTQIRLHAVPLLLDGGDGSLWTVRDSHADWDDIMRGDGGVAERRFIRVSDLIAAIAAISESPACCPVEIDAPPHCGHE
jgi:hypothetical protein